MGGHDPHTIPGHLAGPQNFLFGYQSGFPPSMLLREHIDLLDTKDLYTSEEYLLCRYVCMNVHNNPKATT